MQALLAAILRLWRAKADPKAAPAPAVMPKAQPKPASLPAQVLAPKDAPATATAPASSAAMPAVSVSMSDLMSDQVDDMMRWAAQPGATGSASSPAAPAMQGRSDAAPDVLAVQGVDAAPGPGQAGVAQVQAAPVQASDGSITGSPQAVARALRRPGKILLIGDSLSTTSSHPPGQGWPALVSASLGREIVNNSVGGSTVRDGIRRMPAALAEVQPTVVVLALGGNDGFRRTPIDLLTADLREACTLALQAGALPVLLQMRTRTGTPALYARGFRGAWDAVAAELRVPLVPGFLDPLGDEPQWFEADRTHPNTRAQRVLADHVLAVLRKLASAPA